MNLAHNTWILDGIVDKNQALIDTIQQQVFLEKENSLIPKGLLTRIVQFKIFDEKNHQSDDAQNKISSPAEWKYIVHNNNIRWMEENI